MIERYPLEKAADAYQQMISGKARFRVVLTMVGWTDWTSTLTNIRLEPSSWAKPRY